MATEYFDPSLNLVSAVAEAMRGGSPPAEYDELGAVWRDYLYVARDGILVETRPRDDFPLSVAGWDVHRFALPDSWREPTPSECRAIARALADWAAKPSARHEARVHRLLIQLADCRRTPSPDWEAGIIPGIRAKLASGERPETLAAELIGEHSWYRVKVVVGAEDADRIVAAAMR